MGYARAEKIEFGEGKPNEEIASYFEGLAVGKRVFVTCFNNWFREYPTEGFEGTIFLEKRSFEDTPYVCVPNRKKLEGIGIRVEPDDKRFVSAFGKYLPLRNSV